MSYKDLDLDDFMIDKEFDIVIVPKQSKDDDLRLLCGAFKYPPTLIGLSMKNALLREQLGFDLSTFLHVCDKDHNQYEQCLKNWENWRRQFIAKHPGRL